MASWTAYGEHHIREGTEIGEVDRIDWGFWAGVGPGSEVLGDLTGRRVLDLCSGLGRHAAHLARDHGALVDAIEASPAQHQRALARYPDQDGLHLVLSDAVDHLAMTEQPYDMIYSRHGLSYLDPSAVLPVLARALRPGDRLAFSVIHTTKTGQSPATSVEPRMEELPLGDQQLPVRMWILGVELWEDLLVDHGFILDSVHVLDSPDHPNPVSCRLFVAQRTPRVTSRQRTT
ncbi:class I SAM-dependent methyltransferase [Streptomyces sp. YC419]|uniref:Class I SAM-dependent methyltransferase n=2 Tax=Streptomyces ureilyticus TaxID=1775131 RepID=A0ABX0E516_9ACTN|nr:class I SAM-dependent methyltransferase [Streptomyces ureilyticus]